jgi:hypothetical protein
MGMSPPTDMASSLAIDGHYHKPASTQATIVIGQEKRMEMRRKKRSFRKGLLIMPPLAVFMSMTTLLLAGSQTDSKRQERFMPHIEGNSIVCANKSLAITRTGLLRLSNAKETLAAFDLAFAMSKDSEERQYPSMSKFSEKDAELRREGNVFLIKSKVSAFGQTWPQVEEKIELLKDGLIRVNLSWDFPPPEGITMSFSSNVIDLRGFAGEKMVVNQEEYNSPLELPKSKTLRNFPADKQSGELDISIAPDDPIRGFRIFSSSTSYTLVVADLDSRLTLRMSGHNKKGLEFYIDIRSGIRESKSPETRCGIDFWDIEQMKMPDLFVENYVINPSFEQGNYGYGYSQWSRVAASPESEDTHQIVEDVARFGKRSMRIRTFRPKSFVRDSGHMTPGSAYLQLMTAVIPSGDYVLSYYVKGDQDSGQGFNAFGICRGQGSRRYMEFKPISKTSVTRDWTRHEWSFSTSESTPCSIWLLGTSKNNEGYVWLDGIQFESGERAREFTMRPAETRLTTAAADNYVSDKEEIGAKLLIMAKAGAAGKLSVKVKNFFKEEVFSGEFDFQCDMTGECIVDLPLDKNKLGRGLFVVQSDVELDSGKKCRDFARFSVISYLQNQHRLKNMFCQSYGAVSSLPNFEAILENWRKVGFGSKPYIVNYHVPEVLRKYEKYGVTPLNAIMWSLIYNMRAETEATKTPYRGFGIIDPAWQGKRSPIHHGRDEEPFLVLDYKNDPAGNGKITAEYLKKLEDAVCLVVKASPQIKMWSLGGEEMGKFPYSWWAEEGTREAALQSLSQLLCAFVKGVRRGNPEAMAHQGAPASMNPLNSIPETEDIIVNCAKLGVKFDVIAIHPYRLSPENPDLDSDAKTLFDMMDRHLYEDVPVIWPEMMHYGVYSIPAWNIVMPSWTTATTWFYAPLTYDLGYSERLSAAWRARSWLVALKYQERVLTAQSGGWSNAAFMDKDLTPYASHLIPNTLGNLLGDARFCKDIRFAPYVRAYVFEDEFKRPVAAIWSHIPKVDSGREVAPWGETDFDNILEGAFDLMNNPRTVTTGKNRFPLSPFPYFLRGKPGTLEAMILALEKTSVASKGNLSSVKVSANPVNAQMARMTFHNYISQPQKIVVSGKEGIVPPSGTLSIDLPLAEQLSASRLTRCAMPRKMDINGSELEVGCDFSAFLIERLPDSVRLDADTSGLPSMSFVTKKGDLGVDGTFKLGWNTHGLLLQVDVKDANFVHTEFKDVGSRWNNDCVQVYIDTFANARAAEKHGYDDNDYVYGIFPNAKGDSAIVYREQIVDMQLGLSTAAPQNRTVAEDIPTHFTKSADGYSYKVFFPAKYLLPINLQKGCIFGFGLFVPNVDDPAAPAKNRVVSSLTFADSGVGCFNKPHLWPVAMLVD